MNIKEKKKFAEVGCHVPSRKCCTLAIGRRKLRMDGVDGAVQIKECTVSADNKGYKIRNCECPRVRPL